MRKSILKTMSLCLAMALLLSVFSMPAFAEETEDHNHEYIVTSQPGYSYVDNEQHTVETVYINECTICYHTFSQTVINSQAAHVSAGSGTFEYSYTNSITGDTINYYRYTCRFCGGSFVKAG